MPRNSTTHVNLLNLQNRCIVVETTYNFSDDDPYAVDVATAFKHVRIPLSQDELDQLIVNLIQLRVEGSRSETA